MSFRTGLPMALAALIIFLSAATTARAQGNTIRGKVRNSAGVNVPQITVSLENGTGVLINQTVTNNEGDFVFNELGDTSYLISIAAPDYNPALERVEFVRKSSANDPGEMRTLEITIVRKSNPSTVRREVSFVQDVPQEARESFELAVKLLNDSRVDESLASLQKAINTFPDYFDARLLLASELIKQRRFNDAITHLEQARRVNPKDDRVFQAFGMIMMQQQKFAVAARIFAEAARLNPRDPRYLILQGTALIDQAVRIDAAASPAAAEERNYAFNEAESVLQRAYELSGRKLAEVHLQLARLYEKKGDRTRAANELEQYLRQSPDDKRATEIREAIKKLRATR